MVESLEPKKSQPTVDELVKRFQESPHGIGDTGNNFYRMRAILGAPPRYWEMLPQAQTYREYITDKYRGRPDAAQAIVGATDPSFVEKYDAFAQRINAALGEGVRDKQHADGIASILEEASSFIQEYCKTLPGYTGTL